MEHFDVLIVGAGISGIGAAYHLQTKCPGRTYAILEGREDLGGTWDLFRYPGVRSDSDMYTLGYSFKPWKEQKAIADGDAILRYLHETATENGIDKHIRFSHWVGDASWSTKEATWTVDIERRDTGEKLQYSCDFLFVCGGYYDYDDGYTPEFPGRDRFNGEFIHPQHWPEDLDYSGKNVVVIGSGATAVTLVPEMAKQAGHVTMLQRSPSYVMSRPSQDALANKLRRHLPPMAAYHITRWKNVLLQMYVFNVSKRKPDKVSRFLIGEVKKLLGHDYDVGKHFTPQYDPWDQRICFVPDGDLFHAIKEGRASVATDTIKTFTESGIELESGESLDADIIISATGLKLKLLAGIKLHVDGRNVSATDSLTYKAMMFSDLPNLAYSFGYTNASWTLKSDLTCEYFCRVLNHMKTHGHRVCVPRLNDPSVVESPVLPLNSGYIKRGRGLLPKQGNKAPWKLKHNYAFDIASIRYSRVDDGVMEFG